VSVPASREVFASSGGTQVTYPERNMVCYRIDAGAEINLLVAAPRDAQVDDALVIAPEKPLLYAARSFTGYGQEHGGVQAILTNPSDDDEVEFVYMESLPWFMRVYLHTLDARIVRNDSSSSSPSSSSSNIIHKIHYRPAIDRERGTQLELLMRVPPASTVFLTYDFEKSILRYTEYPPDANRGFDVASAIITTVPKAKDGRRRRTSLRTTALLLSLPTPDFSMPYNVIIFTSTVIALTFGGLYNILTRRFVGADEGPAKLAGVRRVVERVVRWVRRGRSVGVAKKQEKED
jgi:phosphatidylinositol glycan class T